MKVKRIVALLLAAVLMFSLLAGCSKSQSQTDTTDADATTSATPTGQSGQNGQSALSAKYAYKASYKDLDIAADVSYLGSFCAAGTNLYLSAYVYGEPVTETDETGEEYSYMPSEFSILRFDPETGEHSSLPNLQLPEVPEGCEGSVDCYNMSGAADGTLWMLINVWATKYDLPEDFDPETQNQWEYPSTDMGTSYLMHIAEDGSTLASIDLSKVDGTSEDGESSFEQINTFVVDGQGNLYTSDYQYVYVLGADGTLLFKLDCSTYNGSLCVTRPNEVGLLYYSYSETPGEEEDNGRYLLPIDLETQSFGEKQKMPVNTWNIIPGDEVYDFYYVNSYNIYGYRSETQTSDKLVDWLACDVDTNNMYTYAMLSDGRVVGVTQDWSSSEDVQYQLVVLTRVDASELPQKTVLTLACMGLSWELRSQIVAYNKSNDTYRINVLDYSEYATDGDYTAGITKLTTEIIGGSVPDIFLCSNLPIGKYAAKGVIADLYTFMDNDDTVNRSYFVPQILSAMEKDGKLYQLPTSFSVRTAYALSSVADQYDIWNVAAVQDALTQLQDGATVFDSAWTKTDAMSIVLGGNLGTFVDWTTGHCAFDSEAFQQLLVFCKSFPDAQDDNSGVDYAEAVAIDADYDSWESSDMRIKNGKQLMQNLYLYSFEDYVYSTYALNGKISFVGFPSEDGTTGHSFDVRTPLAISSVTEYPQAAWDFVRSIIQQTNEDEDLYYFPVSQVKLNEQAANAMVEELYYDADGNTVDWDGDGEPDKKTKGGYQTIEGDEYIWHEVYALTQADVDQVLSIIENTHCIYESDDEIMAIITEEAAYYFAGDKDVKTTADMIQSRVNLYVQEQR